MKRRELLRHLQSCGCQLHREGGRHSVWMNLANGRKSAVPRHTEVDRVLAREICRQLQIDRVE